MGEIGLADYTKAGRLQQLGNALCAMNPALDVRSILRASARIHNTAKPVREIVGRLQPAAEVKQLGLDMMHAADHDRFRTASERAVLYRDGLLVAFLVHRPLRLANLAAITIGGHLQRRRGGWWRSFDGSEVKGGRDIDGAWPEDLVSALERTTEDHYNRARMVDAGRRYHEALGVQRGSKRARVRCAGSG